MSEELVARFLARGLPEATARFLAFGYEAIAAGTFDWTTGTVKALTGAAPAPFRNFAEANAGVWGR